jgi:hypothetical protein
MAAVQADHISVMIPLWLMLLRPFLASFCMKYYTVERSVIGGPGVSSSRYRKAGCDVGRNMLGACCHLDQCFGWLDVMLLVMGG